MSWPQAGSSTLSQSSAVMRGSATRHSCRMMSTSLGEGLHSRTQHWTDHWYFVLVGCMQSSSQLSLFENVSEVVLLQLLLLSLSQHQPLKIKGTFNITHLSIFSCVLPLVEEQGEKFGDTTRLTQDGPAHLAPETTVQDVITLRTRPRGKELFFTLQLSLCSVHDNQVN